MIDTKERLALKRRTPSWARAVRVMSLANSEVAGCSSPVKESPVGGVDCATVQ
jgi:hypothetical protein